MGTSTTADLTARTGLVPLAEAGIRVCTLEGRQVRDGEDLVPWSGQKLCWDCMDRQLDLMAMACKEVHAPEPGSQPWLDAMADDLASELLRIAGESDDGLALVQRVISRTQFIAGYGPTASAVAQFETVTA